MTPQQEEEAGNMKFVNNILALNTAGMMKLAEYCDAIGEADMARAVRSVAERRYREELQGDENS